jgi:ribosome-associated protein
LKPEETIKLIAQAIFEKKGNDCKVLDIRNVTTITDFFVICSADSDTQVKAIADNIEDKLDEYGVKLWHKEGTQGLNWVLLDYVDVVVHIFKNEIREFYNLEKLWGDAKVTELKDEPEEKPKPVRKKRTTTKSSK